MLKAEIREIVSSYLPYDYCCTASIPGDIHVSRARLPEKIKAVLKDFRNCRVSLQYEQDAAADLYASGIDMMESFDFLIKMDALIPGADSHSLQKIIEFAREIEERTARMKEKLAVIRAVKAQERQAEQQKSSYRGGRAYARA